MITSYPQYRMLSNGKSYYKIIDSSTMEEIQLMSNRYAIHNLSASILPERLLIQDILNLQDGLYTVVDESEYLDVMARCERELERIYI